MLSHLRVLTPHPNILAFYDGRIEGYRFATGPNWVDDGALALGIASYAIVDGAEALVYDTHVSVEHAQAIRAHLESIGVTRMTVVLSHWHLDHIAGNAVFADCEIVSCRRTADHLTRFQAPIETGTQDGPPGIAPLILPTRTYEGPTQMTVGRLAIDLIELNIHSDDATVLWLADERILLAGDTLEDTVTYVAEPEGFEAHLVDLDWLAALAPRCILPNHGDPDRIASGGYDPEFIPATAHYVRALQAMKTDTALRTTPLRELIREPLASGALSYFGAYEEVHQRNVALVAELADTKIASA